MNTSTASQRPAPLPPVHARILLLVLRPFQRFTQTESGSGVVLLIATAVAVAWANSPWGESYFHLWEQKVTIGSAAFGLTETLHHWINDGLMAVFFFLVGLEIKRELLVGQLASVRKAALPIAGAIGGMVVPALLYAMLNAGGPGASGWGIPMATDIAFALGVLALLGPRVPTSLKVFLVALAIVDDIGAVLVIAFFYTASISWTSLAVAAGIYAILITLNAARISHPAPYALIGVALWVAFLKSGVHATIAGVILAMVIPARTRIDADEFLVTARDALADFERAGEEGKDVLTNGAQQEAISTLEDACEEVQSPLMTIEHNLHGVVAFLIMPLFALANAGVRVGPELFAALSPSVTLGIVLGLVLGKPLGITAFAWLAVKLKVAELPTGTTLGMLHAVSWLGGIGFTMSLFIAGLAFADQALLDSAKVGILAASVLAAVVGWILIKRGANTSPATPAAAAASG